MEARGIIWAVVVPETESAISSKACQLNRKHIGLKKDKINYFISKDKQDCGFNDLYGFPAVINIILD